MENDIMDDVIEDLFHVLTITHRKLLKIGLEGMNKDISRPHFAIMRELVESAPQAISEIGKRLLIPKSQMTHLVDKLINLGMVKRLPNAKDRRIINIVLTDKGKTALKKGRQLIKDNFRKRLAYLTDEELTALSLSLKKLRGIGVKID